MFSACYHLERDGVRLLSLISENIGDYSEFVYKNRVGIVVGNSTSNEEFLKKFNVEVIQYRN